jgi:lipopolysaccharide export system protein LptA
MKKNSRSAFFNIIIIIAVVVSVAAFAAETTLVADSMRYDPRTGEIVATGNVRVVSPDGEVTGDAGRGSAAGNDFEIRGNVRGHYNDAGGVIKFSCASATVKGRDKSSRVVTASGDVRLTKGRDSLAASVVVWGEGADRYSAAGGVIGDFGAYSIDADVVSRDAENFHAAEVREFHERGRKITISASRADGIIKNGEVAELTAEGGVVITMPGKNGVITRATGGKCIYSLARGTVVLTRNAMITQTGRVLRSDHIVYFLDTGRIDAQGSPSITFDSNRGK